MASRKLGGVTPSTFAATHRCEAPTTLLRPAVGLVRQVISHHHGVDGVHMTKMQGGPTRALLFYAIALVLAVVLAAWFTSALGEAVALVTMLTPATAVVITMLLTGEGRSAADWRSLGITHAGFKGWWLAILGPVAILVASYDILLVVGAASFRRCWSSASPTASGTCRSCF